MAFAPSEIVHGLLVSRQLWAAVSQVMQVYEADLKRWDVYRRGIEQGARDRDDLNAATHLAKFLLVNGDEVGARLAIQSTIPADSEPGLVNICRLTGRPGDCFELETLAPEPASGLYLEPILKRWSDDALAWAARNRVPAAVARLENGYVLGQSFVSAATNWQTCLNFFTFNPGNAAKVRGFESIETFPIAGPRALVTRFTGSDEYPEGLLIGSDANFGHWMLNHLGRLALSRAIPRLHDVPLVVGENLTSSQAECLALLGYTGNRLIRLRQGRLAKFRRLWVPMMTFCSAYDVTYWLRSMPAFLRHSFGVKSRPVDGTEKRRRLYLTRRSSRWRRVVNENEFEALLAKYGFEIVDPGALSIRQQLDLASGAEIIIGAFGAGMNLLLFAPDDACVMELKPSAKLLMDINPALCREIGQHYVEVVGTPHAVEGQHPLHYDFLVRPADIEAALVSMNIPVARAG